MQRRLPQFLPLVLVAFSIMAGLGYACSPDRAPGPDPSAGPSAPVAAEPVGTPPSGKVPPTGTPSATLASRPPDQARKTTIGQFTYWHHVRNGGPTPAPGQAVFYHYQMTRGNRIIQTNFGGQPSGGILPSEEISRKQPQAIEEADAVLHRFSFCHLFALVLNVY